MEGVEGEGRECGVMELWAYICWFIQGALRV